MQHSNRWMVAVLVIASQLFWGCQHHADHGHAEHPAKVEDIEGSELSLVTLTEKAIQRIDLKTDQVHEAKVNGSTSRRKVVPYSALIYDPQGQTWVYISPKPRAFVRHPVEVDYIDGDLAVLNEGPAIGTVVASVGVAELYGTDFGVGH